MSANQILPAIAVCLGALVAGTGVGFVLGGLGICALDLTPGLVGFAIVLGGGLSAGVAMLWPKAWWAGAVAFSAPALLGVVSGVAVGEWKRVLCTCLSIVAAVLGALLIHRGGRPQPGGGQ